MRISDEIRIIDLLIRRDAEFLQVRRCEDQIAAILDGASWPYCAPPSPLPSAGRTSARKAWKPGGDGHGKGKTPPSGALAPANRGAGTAIAVRDLDETRENAYRVAYVDNGVGKSGFLNTRQTLESLLQLECGSFRIASIDTVNFRGNDDFDVVARIYERLT